MIHNLVLRVLFGDAGAEFMPEWLFEHVAASALVMFAAAFVLMLLLGYSRMALCSLPPSGGDVVLALAVPFMAPAMAQMATRTFISLSRKRQQVVGLVARMAPVPLALLFVAGNAWTPTFLVTCLVLLDASLNAKALVQGPPSLPGSHARLRHAPVYAERLRNLRDVLELVLFLTRSYFVTTAVCAVMRASSTLAFLVAFPLLALSMQLSALLVFWQLLRRAGAMSAGILGAMLSGAERLEGDHPNYEIMIPEELHGLAGRTIHPVPVAFAYCLAHLEAWSWTFGPEDGLVGRAFGAALREEVSTYKIVDDIAIQTYKFGPDATVENSLSFCAQLESMSFSLPGLHARDMFAGTVRLFASFNNTPANLCALFDRSDLCMAGVFRHASTDRPDEREDDFRAHPGHDAIDRLGDALIDDSVKHNLQKDFRRSFEHFDEGLAPVVEKAM